MKEQKFDLCVIGAGPGGYVAAIHAAKKGASVAIIEKENFGGTCLNIGCIPTKTLIASVEVLVKLNKAEEFGIKLEGKAVADWAKMQTRKDEIIVKLRAGINGLLKAAGVNIIKGTASFSAKKTIITDTKEKITAKNFIIATGSESLVPGFIPESKKIISSTELLSIKKIPKSLLILGGGVIGCEFACLFAELGTEVTIVEMQDSIIPILDKELSRTLTQYMKKQGIKIITGNPLENIKATTKSVTGTVKGDKLSGEYLLVSIGRKSTVENLNLAVTGVKTDDRGWISVTDKCKTNVAGIYAIGDVTGKWQLAHAASAMGIVAAESITKTGNKVFTGNNIPGCIFTAPEIGTVGLTEEECKDKDIKITKGKFPFAALGKAMALNETDGFCKIIADADTDQILGVHIIGPHATDLISEASVALQLESTAKELGNAIHAHPTLGEIMMETAHAVHGDCAHVAVPRKRK